MTHHKSELLLPAGSLEKLKVAILYGADAVYLGTPDMSLRTRSKFSLEDVIKGVNYAHEHGKRAYLTLNLFSHNSDIEKLPGFINTIRRVKPDGVIIADPGIFNYVKTQAPELELHISTQANICSYLSVQFWESLGADLVVLAREVSFDEMKDIRKKCPLIKLEAFVHGAMCMTYSGRCMLSNFLAERGANQGNCANSCRWKYKLHLKRKDGTLEEVELNEENKKLFDFFLEEEQRPGELLPFEENERGAFILNSKDLCLMPHLDEYLESGIDSLKVEGRNRSAYYLATTAHAYRQAIDDWYVDPINWEAKKYMRELQTIPNKGYTMAFHEGKLSHHAHNYEDTHTIAPWEYAGIITKVDDEAFYLDVKNRMQSGEVLEFIPPGKRPPMRLRIYEFDDVHNRRKNNEVIHAGQQPLLRIPFSWFNAEDKTRLKDEFPAYTVVRKKRVLNEEEAARKKLDLIASGIESGKGNEEIYQKKRQALVEAQAETETKKDKPDRKPNLGSDGCCGRGCNGCLHFWKDDKYKKSRALLHTKDAGTLLTHEEAKANKEKLFTRVESR